MEYLSLDDALFIHAEQLKLFGGAPGVRDLGLIESALLRRRPATTPIWSSRQRRYGKALRWASSTATNASPPPAWIFFLGLNGARLEAEPDAVITLIYSHLEAGTFRKPVLEAWLRERVAA